ncbi:MAG: ribosomal protein S18 acetylase RimI-like enzyme [Verrucomicrobiales bacterium]|jgi:ribosomal protein S18 acetylase RimI-like enzyme
MDSQPKTEIREAIQSDLPFIIRMLTDDKLGSTRESFEEPLPVSYINAFEEISESSDNQLLVAISENVAVGVLQITFIPNLTFKGGKRALIEGVRVDAGHRSRGIGRIMIEEVVARAKAEGCHLIQLTTNKSRPEAKDFYESLGFRASHEGLKLFINQKTRI